MQDVTKNEATLTVRNDIGDKTPRVHDLDLAKRLGIARPRDIRKTIERHLDAGNLTDEGTCATVAHVRGNVVTEYWLDEASALFVASQSGTEKAIAITKEVIAVFIAARNGTLAPVTHLLLADVASEWQPMWKRELQDEFCEIYGKPKTKRPPRFLAGVQSLIYKRIAGGDTYAEMKRRIPDPKHGANLHQLFNDKARGGFEGQLAVVLGILRTSHNPRDFWARFNFLYTDRPMQLPLGAA